MATLAFAVVLFFFIFLVFLILDTLKVFITVHWHTQNLYQASVIRRVGEVPEQLADVTAQTLGHCFYGSTRRLADG